MLAQNFQTAEALDIPETHRQALMKTLVLLETGKLKHQAFTPYAITDMNPRKFTGHFNMNAWRVGAECGTVCCMGGTAELVGKVNFTKIVWDNEAIGELFLMMSIGACQRDRYETRKSVAVPQAAVALRSYLTTGAANWKAALAT